MWNSSGISKVLKVIETKFDEPQHLLDLLKDFRHDVSPRPLYLGQRPAHNPRER
jgi:hypothetical protein